MKPINILLVDDDPDDVAQVREAFRRAEVSFPVYSASNAHEALELLRGEELPRPRRLVLLDLNMPSMDGIAFLRTLREDPALRRTPVVVLTGSIDERNRLDAYELNVAGYLLKSTSFAAFVDRIAALARYWSMMEMARN